MVVPESTTDNGRSIDGYRIVRPLGGDGATFLAHDRDLDRALVLSFLPAAPEARAARLAVARKFASVSHPNLGRVHRVRDGGPHPYLVSAFARGEKLDAIARPLPPARVLDLGRGLAGALEELHAAGAAHGGIQASRVILSEDGTPCLVGLDRARADAGVADRLADVHALLALLLSVADPELARSLEVLGDPANGVTSAGGLRRALEGLARPMFDGASLSDNPYRGLRAFESENSATFFGREREVVALVERLRAQPWLLVAGRSGAGKSSLVRAGLAPAIAAGALGERASWNIATMVPGPDPVGALANALAPHVHRDRVELAAALRHDPALGANLARASRERGLLLIVDQLEELLTLANEEERSAFCVVLERFGALAPGVRVIFTLRSDFLDQLVALDRFGPDLLRAAFVLPQMGRERLREAIVSPARARGFELETPAMVDALVDEVSQRSEALPLLSFALAELWNERDVARRVMSEQSLRRLGGAVAALARHGDLLLATLSEPERREARRILLALVAGGSPDGAQQSAETRTRRTVGELVGASGEPARVALEALVRGRLVVVGETCEIAHEALVSAWPRLRAWLDGASEVRTAAERVRRAAREWKRGGCTDEALFGERQLAELGVLRGVPLGDEAEAFVTASRATLRRARLRRRLLLHGLPLLLALLGAATWGVSTARHRSSIANALAAAHALDAKAEESARAADRARAEALALFDRDDLRAAEERWSRMLALEEDTDRQRRDVAAALDEAIALDPLDPATRALDADLTLARLLAAERLHKGPLLAELEARLSASDDGSRAAHLRAPARVRVSTDPPGATLTVARYREDDRGKLIASEAAPLPEGTPRELPSGSYLITAEAPGRYPTRYPFSVHRGEDRALRITLPSATDVPEGMIYVPAGRFPYGSSDDEDTRALLTHQPLHDIEVGAFLIARTEVTIGDYVAFLATLSEADRRAQLTSGLVPQADGQLGWRHRGQTNPPHAMYCNGLQPCIDWARLPIGGMSREEGARFAAWLSRSGRLPGARLCTDREWERAARGGDDRRYPNGNGDLTPGDACTLAAYGGDDVRSGPCPPGSYPASRSPFGVDDMTGNEWEWTASPPDRAFPEQAVTRGAGWDDDGLFVVLANRGVQDEKNRFRTSGARICADTR